MRGCMCRRVGAGVQVLCGYVWVQVLCAMRDGQAGRSAGARYALRNYAQCNTVPEIALKARDFGGKWQAKPAK